MVEAYESDRSALNRAGYAVDTHIAQPSFYRATVTKSGESVKLESVRDTAFRVFPVIEDDELGYRLHDVDLAVNKGLALANRSEVRDALDCIELAAEDLVHPVDPKILKKALLDLIARTRATVSKLNAIDIGYVFIDAKGQVVKEISGLDTSKVTRHAGSVKGSWPRIVR